MTDATHFEAKLHALRRTNDGMVVSFLIHPNEVPSCIALDPLGQRYMVALAGINDDETARGIPGSVVMGALNEDGHVLDLKERAAKRAQVRYANGTEGERARTRAGMLPKDERFWFLEPDDAGFDAFADCEGGCGV